MAPADEDPDMQEMRRMTAKQAAKAVKLEDEVTCRAVDVALALVFLPGANPLP